MRTPPVSPDNRYRDNNSRTTTWSNGQTFTDLRFASLCRLIVEADPFQTALNVKVSK